MLLSDASVPIWRGSGANFVSSMAADIPNVPLWRRIAENQAVKLEPVSAGTSMGFASTVTGVVAVTFLLV